MFAWLELRVHCHATEEQEKVAKAIDFLCPQAQKTITKTEGHHRNPILVMTARTDSQRAIREFWKLMSDQMMIGRVLDILGNAIDDNGVLHLRLGKQEAYLGKVEFIGQEDAVAVKMKVARIPSGKKSVSDIARETLLDMAGSNVPHN